MQNHSITALVRRDQALLVAPLLYEKLKKKKVQPAFSFLHVNEKGQYAG